MGRAGQFLRIADVNTGQERRDNKQMKHEGTHRIIQASKNKE